MAFEASKRDWSELYAFFHLLADGYVWAGGANGAPNEEKKLNVAMVQREEHDGTRKYIIEGENIHIVGEGRDERFPREDFATVAMLVGDMLKQGGGEEELTSPDGVEEFLDAVAIYNLEAKTDDRTDFYVAFWSVDAPLVGFRSNISVSGINSNCIQSF